MIPKPKRIKYKPGSFQINPETRIIYSDSLERVARYLQRFLKSALGELLSIKPGEDSENLSGAIHLKLSQHESETPESYFLIADSELVQIIGTDPAGVFYGVQSLRQLLPFTIESKSPVLDPNWTLPGVEIEDQPRYSWRGLHLDVSRHRYPIEFLKKLINVMALYKMNTFHLHLTDDQGWRIEIKKYPLLTEVGGYRGSTPIPHDRSRSDHTPYSGFYTQEEIMDLVSYADEHFITIIPEIEMPGHALAALAAYPAFGCLEEGYQVGEVWGMQDEAFCPGNDDLYPFLEDILSEIMAIFPSKYIHIGGDECRKTHWKTCPKCQARIKREGLKDEDQLQSYFLERIGRFLDKQERRMIGWDEILEGGLPSGAAVMSWRGADGGIQSARAGHEVVMTPNTHCYFDYYQSKDLANEPPAIGGYLPLEKVYGFDPIEGVPTDFQRYILGGQANIWTEYLPTSDLVEYMAFPRILALTEAVWRGKGEDFPEFIKRVREHLNRLDQLGIEYRPLP